MINILKSAVMACALIAAPTFAATTVVNVDGVANASLDGSNAVNVSLGAGSYSLKFTQGAFTSFSRFNGESGCDSNGANCVQGFENSVRYVIGNTTKSFGDGAADGGYGPVNPGDGYYSSAALSLSRASAFTDRFTLTAATTVSFYLYDDFLSDNRGGVSLAVSGDVPEPATWAMMLLGFGGVGAAVRRKTKTATQRLSAC